MSLSEAVLVVVEAMEAEAVEPCEHAAPAEVEILRRALKSYARELRVAIKASAGATASPPTNPFGLAAGWVSPQAQHAQAIDQAREEFRKHKQRGDAEEGLDGKMVEARGGPCEGTFVNVPSDVTPGMKSLIAGGVYQFGEDNILHYLPQDSNAKDGDPRTVQG